MEKNFVSTGNKLIIEFMGLIVNNNIVNCPENIKYHNERCLNGFNISMAKYNISWDWLMPVVEKIEKSTINSSINGITTMIGLSIDHTYYSYIAFNKIHIECKGLTKLNATYKAVLKFIEWYNKNKKKE